MVSMSGSAKGGAKLELKHELAEHSKHTAVQMFGLL